MSNEQQGMGDAGCCKNGLLNPVLTKRRSMKGIKTNVLTEWKNYVIKADADKARYHKVEYGKDNLNGVLLFTGLTPGKKYTISGKIKLNIQQTDAQKYFEFHSTSGWYSMPGTPIAGEGDLTFYVNYVLIPPTNTDEKTIWEIGTTCMRPEWNYVPHDGDYYIFEHVMVNEGDKPLPYIDPE
jgi:hypothetical protein